MEYNIDKLFEELVTAGIKSSGCNEHGIVWDDNNKEIQDRPDVKAIIAKHDPAPIPEETLEQKIERIVNKKMTKG